MVASSFVIAASSMVALTLGAPVFHSHHSHHVRAAHSLVERSYSYQVFSGDGSTAEGWPSEESWKSFEDAWTTNLPLISASCAQFNVAENSESEMAAIKSGLVSAATETGLSSSYLLAIMMQESKGCVRVPTTNYGVRNPGLMQDYNGAASCNDGTVINPCPDATIAQMISEGAGIGMVVGLSIGVAATDISDVSKYYKAARIYNSGSIDISGNLGAGVATHCYVSDIANRLLGWTTETSSCSEATIGSLNGGSPSTVTQAATSSSAVIVAQAATSSSAVTVTSATPTPTPTAGTTAPSSPFPGASSACKSWYEVKSGDNCLSTSIGLATLRSLNNGLDATCSNLWRGYSYCIAA